MTDKNENPGYTDFELKTAVVAAIEAGLFEKAGPWFKVNDLSLGRTPEEIVAKLKENSELAADIVTMTYASEPDPPQGDPPAPVDPEEVKPHEVDGDAPPEDPVEDPPADDEPPKEEPPAEDPPEQPKKPEKPKKPASGLVDKKNLGKAAFKITLPEPYSGPEHGVTFAHGVGVLSLFGVSFHRPEWVTHDV